MELFCTSVYDSFWQNEVTNALLHQDLGLVCCMVLETPVQVGFLSRKQDAEGSGIARIREGATGDWPTDSLLALIGNRNPANPRTTG